MKRTYLLIFISSVALIFVLLIQINWILQSAKIKEQLFNETANMVLSKTTEAVRADQATCKGIEDSVEGLKSAGSAANLGVNEIRVLDSLFAYYMHLYNFHVDYTFEVVKTDPVAFKYQTGISELIYNRPSGVREISEGIELKLTFPDKRQFIIAEMGVLFITSVILIIIVLLLFWKTVSSLIKEKIIAEHTTDFLNNMTHEFRTPLTNIALAGKMMIRDSVIPGEEKIRHYTGIILDENEKLQFQINQVLSMASLERGEIPFHKSTLNFHDLINDTLKNINIQFEDKRGHADLKLNAVNSIVTGDKIHLENVLRNLVDNAIKYTDVKPELTITTTNIGPDLIVSIKDRGIGIGREFQNEVFEKYFRVPTGNLHDVKGFGLGLAYVKKVIELHDGTVGLQSEINNGSTFTITIPNA